jgi:hypothetical protein
MRPGTWALVLVVLAAVLAGGGYVLVQGLRLALPAPRACGPWRCAGPAEVLPRVEAAAERALACLELDEATAAELRRGTGLYVQPRDTWPAYTWTEDGGLGVRTVAEVVAGRDVLVGRNLLALAHGLAHVVEQLDGGTDPLHASPAWVGPGGWYQRLGCCEGATP